MGRVAVYTIGCKVNQAESEELKMALAAAGHVICRDPAAADLCVVNTCTVTAESDRKCRKLIRWLSRSGAKAIAAAGCYAEVSPRELASLPRVARVIPNRRKRGWAEEIADMLPRGEAGESGWGRSRARGFIKVQDGCERGCSYCIVPRARGRERSRPLVEVKTLARRWLEQGTGELVLCGVNLGRFGGEADLDLSALVREVLALGDGFRVRLSSIELEDLKREWLEEWAECGRVCPHLHLPLQSGDEDILADMGRGYRPEDFLAAAENLRRVWPQAALTTEVIVGYPGESGAAFRRTLEVLEAAAPSRLHVFRFSPRPGTRAYGLAGAVCDGASAERSELLRGFAQSRLLGYAEERRGERRVLLVEELAEKDGRRAALGTTEDYIKACMPDPPPGTEAGSLVEGRLGGWSRGRALLERAGQAAPEVQRKALRRASGQGEAEHGRLHLL